MRLSSVAWNGAGLAAPLVVAVLAVPPLLHALGQERFGLLSLAWALTAMAGLFDLGIGRAATRLVAEQIGKNEPHKVRGTMTTSVRIALATGTAGGVFMAVLVAAGAYRLLHFTAGLEGEVEASFLLLALALPMQAVIATYRGVNEACQAFRGISLVRMGLGVANFGAPLLVAQWTPRLEWAVVSLLLARAVALFAFRWLARAATAELPDRGEPMPVSELRGLFRSGAWYTVSAVVSPILVQADRFFIGSRISAAAVTSYTIPFDMITQLLIGVSAISTVAFPSIATHLHKDPLAARRLFMRWTRVVAVGMGVITASVALVLPEALSRWLGSALPPESVEVGRWLCLGVWFNSIGAMYFALLHARGMFRATAWLHVMELPAYVACLLVLLGTKGVVGAAIAWTIRVAIDAIALMALDRAIHMREYSDRSRRVELQEGRMRHG